MRSGSNKRGALRPDVRRQSVCSVSDAFAAWPLMMRRPEMGSSLKAASLALAVLALAGCAQQHQARNYDYSRGKEYFAQGRYGKASPRVVLEGESVPKGGGRYLVGKPYRIAGRTYVPSEKEPGWSVVGTASWYGAAFHGRRTANGEIYDMQSITAAHPTMPLPSYVRVTNTKNGKSLIVRVNDRGPYHGGRVMDMSQRVAELLEFRGAGTARVRVDYIGKAGLGGSDDTKLASTLSTGAPAQLEGYETPAPATMVAAVEPQAQPAPEAPREPAPRAPKPSRHAPTLAAPAAPDPETSAPLAPETAAAPEPPRQARAEKPAPARHAKPTVLDAVEPAQDPEADGSARAAARDARAQGADAQDAAAETPDAAPAPQPAAAPLPPRRPTAFMTPAVTDQEDAAPTPKPVKRRTHTSAVELYYAPGASVAARLSGRAGPFEALRDVTDVPGR